MKRRWLRILLIVLALVSVAGFGAFSTFLFNPFEGRYEYELPSLIPREVDFFLGKQDLRADFDPFPVPAFLDELRADPSGQALLELPGVQELAAELDVGARVAELQRALDGLPVKLDVLEVFGGERLAVAGTFRGADLAASDWAVYGRANWLGKLLVELLRYPDLIGASERGLVVDEQEEHLELSGAGLARPLYVTRLQDVVVLASAADLVRRAHELEASRGENSFYQSAKYADHIGLLQHEGHEVEVYLDYHRLAEAQGWPDGVPSPSAEDLAVALCGRVFQVGLLRELIGLVGFDGGLSVRLTAPVSSEQMTPFQKRLYRQRGFDKARALEVARLAPADAGLFVYLHAGLGDLLREALATLGDKEVGLLDDTARAVWDKTALELIDDIDAVFKDRVGLVLRDHDFPDEGESGPPHNEDVVPAWSLLLWIDDRAKLDELRERIVARQGDLGIKGREAGSRGVFVNTVLGNYKAYEYWNELVPGTGHVATLDLGDEYFLVGNHTKMLELMVKTYFDGAPTYPRLSDDGFFKSLVNTGLADANLLGWLAPRAVERTLRAAIEREVREALYVDWSVEKPRLERKLVAEKLPGERYGALTPSGQQQLDILYFEAADALEEEARRREGPQLKARLLRQLQAAELVKGALAEVSVDQKRIELFARAIVPFDGPPSP